MTKSYVSLERKVCPVCGEEFDSGALFLDKRMRESMEHHTITGWALCPEHQRLFDEGYVALVGIDKLQSRGSRPGEVWRTGKLAHIRRSVWPNVFNVPLDDKLPLVWVENDVIEKLKERMPKEEI